MDKKNWPRRLSLPLSVLIISVFALVIIGWKQVGSEKSSSKADLAQLESKLIRWEDPVTEGLDIEPYYADVLKRWEEQGLQTASSAVTIPAARPSNQSDEQLIRIGTYEGKNDVLIWDTNEVSWVEYTFDVPEEGLYEIAADYHPLIGEGNTRPIVWDVSIDGDRPYREASSITLYREWRDKGPIQTNEDGDQIRPTAYDVSTWSEKPFIDSGAAYIEPLQWYLTKGKHTIRLEGYEPVAISALYLKPPANLPSYEEALAAYPPVEQADVEVITLQAEQMTSKNDSSIQMFSDRDRRTVPLAKGRMTYNTVGGLRWDWPNQAITWEFEVPETGRYKLALRTLQNRFSQKASFRTIHIDGKVPFSEFLAYRFPYHPSWQGTVLENERGEPYVLYLEKGKHTLSLQLTHATVSPVVRGIEQVSTLLREVQQDLLAMTGGQADRNRSWNVQRDLPDLQERLEIAADNLDVLSEMMEATNGEKDSTSEGFRTSASDLRALLGHLDEVPYHIDEIASTEGKINNFIVNLYKQPLLLDEIYIAPADKTFPKMTASWVQKLTGYAANFIYSFDTRDSLANVDDKKLNVWVQRGQDYVTQLQELADEMFTPQTGIKVKVNLLPNPQLLVMSNAAGLQPDVALGLSQDLPVDYAIRGSVHDLSQFHDFSEVYDKFSPGSWLPLYYDKGYYAVPETQSFQVLYYRKDLMSQLGLGVPETWEEVYDLLPVLQQNYMNFYVNPQDFLPFIYQNEAQFFTASGTQTALDSPEGFKAFKQWTDLFNTYAMQREVPSFYQHFRQGTMPIGISDYNMYLQLSAAAPELNGRWGIALMPGMKQTDGAVTRWAGGAQTTGVIFEASNKKEEAWQFLKWWVSADVQARYGSDLESINGVSFRWNTANVEAFAKLPWKTEDANIILHQWMWYKDKPNPPGGYFLGRELGNAWVRTVVNGMNYRSSLETAVIDINRELRRKQQEFGFMDENGESLKSLDFPEVKQPWEGVKAYVK